MSALDPEIRKYVEEWLNTRIGVALDGKNVANFAAATAQTAFVGVNEVLELLENHREKRIASEVANLAVLECDREVDTITKGLPK